MEPRSTVVAKSGDFAGEHARMNDTSPQVAPAVGVGTHSMVGGEDLRQRGFSKVTRNTASKIGTRACLINSISRRDVSKPPPIWILVLALLFFSACQPPLGSQKTDVFILPHGLVGRVVIFYDQPGGQQERIVGDDRIFIVPENGVVFTQSSPIDGWTQFPRYYYDTITMHTIIPTRMDWNDYSVDGINASLVSSGTFQRKAGSDKINFGVFFVGTRAQIDSAAKVSDQQGVQSMFSATGTSL